MLKQLSRVGLIAVLAIIVFSSSPVFGQDAEANKSNAHLHDGEGHQHGDHDDQEAHDHVVDEAAHEATAEHHGGGGDPHGTPPLLQFDIGSAICNIAIFLGVFAILSKFVWPVILGGLKAREEKIHDELESAANANLKAQELLEGYKTQLDGAATQVQAMLADARKDAEASGQRIVEDAKAEAERQRERAIADIETAKKVALSELAGQTSDMAINVAKQVVGRELKGEDHADLIRQALDRLPSNN